MCRNIKTLFNLDPPVTGDEIRAASLQFVRKISGYRKPSRLNEAVFEAAVEDIATIAGHLLASLETGAPARTRSERGDNVVSRSERQTAPRSTGRDD